jgi:hypothetical protein
MTVINTNYSTIDEAWGNSFSGKNMSKKKKKVAEPICDLYDKKSLKSRKPYMDDQVDPYEYHGEVFGPYDKVKFSRTTKPRDNECARVQQARRKFKPVTVEKMEDEYSAVADPDIDDDDSYFQKAVIGGSSRGEDEDSELDFAEDETLVKEEPRGRGDRKVKDISPSVSMKYTTEQRERLFDFGLYIGSGIMLIIILEQILQLGMRMRY